MRPLTAFVTAAVCLAVAGVATAQPEQRIMLSQVLDAPLLSEPARPTSGEPAPIASVKDLLVGGDGPTEVIVLTDQSMPAGHAIPWNELNYDAVRNRFTLRAQGDNLKRFPPWQAPTSDTQGGASRLLASKLLNGLVQTPAGERLGEVKDVALDTNGDVTQVFFRRGQLTATIPWKSVDVQSERTGLTASPGAEAVIVVDRKRL